MFEQKKCKAAKRLTRRRYNRILSDAEIGARIRQADNRLAILDMQLEYQTKFQEEAYKILFPKHSKIPDITDFDVVNTKLLP